MVPRQGLYRSWKTQKGHRKSWNFRRLKECEPCWILNAIVNYTVKPARTATSLQLPPIFDGFFFHPGGRIIDSLLF